MKAYGTLEKKHKRTSKNRLSTGGFLVGLNGLEPSTFTMSTLSKAIFQFFIAVKSPINTGLLTHFALIGLASNWGHWGIRWGQNWGQNQPLKSRSPRCFAYEMRCLQQHKTAHIFSEFLPRRFPKFGYGLGIGGRF